MTFLLGLLSAVLIAVAFCHLRLSFYCLLLFLFCCFLAPWSLPSCRYCLLGLPCHSSLLSAILILAAIFIAVPFSLLPSILSLFSRGFSFKAGPFFCWIAVLLWFCRRHIHLVVKDAFVVTTGCRPLFFFWLSLFSSFSRHCSYCHCSTDNNSHTVVLSKPASYSPALFSISP